MGLMKWVRWVCVGSYIWAKKLEFMRDALMYILGMAGPSGFGSSSTGEEVTDQAGTSHSSPHLTAIITGATSGIGAETARVLAKRGVRLVMPVRDLKKAGEVKKRIEKESPEAEIIVMEMDLSSFSSIQNFCYAFLRLGLPLNILINNAGKFCRRMELTENKFEMAFATNYLGPYLLTKLLLERMVETASKTGIQGRIINVTSIIHRWVTKERFKFEDMLLPESYNGTHAYAASKLANIMHAKEMTRQLREREANVTMNSVHPGIVKTGIIRDHRGFIIDLMFFLASRLLKSVKQGASTTCYLALNPQVNGVTGKHFVDCNESSCSPLADDQSEAFDLWEKTDVLVHRTLHIQGSEFALLFN